MHRLTLDKLPKRVLARIDLQTAFMASRCVIAAERLKLFRKLEGKKLTAKDIGRLTGIRGWRREIFLAALVGLGLLVKKGKLYWNSPLASKYYIKERSIYWTDIYSGECIEEYQAFSVLEEMLKTGRDYASIMGFERKSYIEMLQKDRHYTNGFTHMLFYFHQPVAKALARHVDLRRYKKVLDVGGGSGVMSMALVKKFPHLMATVLDFEPVCRVANRIIKKQGLSKQVKTFPGDMNDEFPAGHDIIMFCDVGRIDTSILKKTYNILPDGGLLILADSFASEDLTDPFGRLMWQLRSDASWLTTRKEAVKMVRQSGFKSVRLRHIYGESWLITGHK